MSRLFRYRQPWRTSMKPKSLAFILSLATAAPGQIYSAQAQLSQAESPAFQGHAAEMQLRTEEEERRRRELFFDPVHEEIGEPQVPCDHRARSNPQAIAGPAYVAILNSQGKDRERLRVWIAPGAARSADEALQAARELASRNRNAAPPVLIELRPFLACR